MKIDERMSMVMADLEFLIGNECYNGNSYDGWHDIQGCEFRYPVYVPDAEGEYHKERQNLNHAYTTYSDSITPDMILGMKYKFGANQLYIGAGIKKVMEYLEKRYNIDFNELEAKYKK